MAGLDGNNPGIMCLSAWHSDVSGGAVRALHEGGTVRAVEPSMALSQRDSSLTAAAEQAVAAIQARLGGVGAGPLALADGGSDAGALSVADDPGALALADLEDS